MRVKYGSGVGRYEDSIKRGLTKHAPPPPPKAEENPIALTFHLISTVKSQLFRENQGA
jgi:hypothetical protein